MAARPIGFAQPGGLRPFWGGIFCFFLKLFPNGIVPNEALFIRLSLTSYQVVCLALRNFGSGIRLLTHKSPFSKKRRQPLQEIAAENYPDTVIFSSFEAERYRTASGRQRLFLFSPLTSSVLWLIADTWIAYCRIYFLLSILFPARSTT